MAGKLEIRVVPKEQTNKDNVPKQENLSQIKMNAYVTSHDTIINTDKCNNDAQVNVVCNQNKPKSERTKKILKQSSKERTDSTELQSPSKEKVTFALETNLVKNIQENKEVKKRVSLEIDNNIEKNKEVNNAEDDEESVKEKPNQVLDVAKTNDEKLLNTETCKAENESTSTETEQKNSKEKSDIQKIDTKTNNRLSINTSPVINIDPVIPLSRSNSQKAISKQLEAVKNNLVDSRSDSSSSTQCRINDKMNVDESVEFDGKAHLNTDIKEKIICSPAVDLTSNPAVTFVSPSSIPDIK